MYHPNKSSTEFWILSLTNDLLSEEGRNCVIELEGLSFILVHPCTQ